MLCLIHLTISFVSIIAIVLSCILFTNAIEFLGNKLKLGNNATGSILAVLGTGLPETIIPIVAILGINFSNIKINTAQNIALGAVVGSPFMLATFALFLLGIVLIIKKRSILNVNKNIVLRDYKYFIFSYTFAILFSFKYLTNFKYIAIFILFILYAIFVYRTILQSRTTCIECECEKLYFSRANLNQNIILTIQLLFSLFILFTSSHCFVNEINFFSKLFNIQPEILALLITPFATELPEIINSIIWLKQGKDELAIANILGAIVFQSSILFALGLILTPWHFSNLLLLNTLLTICCSFLFVISILINKKLKLVSLLFCGTFYIAYIIFVFNT